MAQFSNSLIIQADIEDVFAFLERMEYFPVWNYAVQRIEKTSSGDNSIGSRYHLYRNQGLQAFEEITITEYIRDKKLVLESQGNHFSYRMTYDLNSQFSGTTELINKSEIRSSGFNNVMIGLLQGNIKKEVNQNLHLLKSILEDGRNKHCLSVL